MLLLMGKEARRTRDEHIEAQSHLLVVEAALLMSRESFSLACGDKLMILVQSTTIGGRRMGRQGNKVLQRGAGSSKLKVSCCNQ